MNNWYMKYAVVVISAMTGCAAYQWVPWSTMGAAEWASWVQAIGSIGAIIGAFLVVGYQHRRAELALSAGRLADDIAKLEAIKFIAERAIVKISGTAKIAYKHRLISRTNFPGAAQEGFTSSALLLSNEFARVLREIPIYSPPYIKIASAILVFQEAMDTATRLLPEIERGYFRLDPNTRRKASQLLKVVKELETVRIMVENKILERKNG